MNNSSYRDLKVWRKSMDCVKMAYDLIKILPVEERFALADQMRRAAVSIPSNIAEGHRRNSEREFMQFIAVGRGSTAELETQFILASELGYLTQEQVEPIIILLNEIDKMLWALNNHLRSKAR